MPFCLRVYIAASIFLIGGCTISNGQDPQPALENTEWLAEDILQAGVLDMLQSTLKFDVNLNVSGNGGCNRYFGSATVQEDEMNFGALTSTRMACPPAIMDQEQRFFTALNLTRTWQIDTERELLTMKNEDGRTILRFSRLTPRE